MTVSWSVGEARALAIKAARGVGMTWGEAEEAGFALGWLTRHNAPGITAICRYLSFYDQSVKSGDAPLRWLDKSAQGWFCPIGIGAALSDGAIPTTGNRFEIHARDETPVPSVLRRIRGQRQFPMSFQARKKPTPPCAGLSTHRASAFLQNASYTRKSACGLLKTPQ